jgi:hypothetical protein
MPFQNKLERLTSASIFSRVQHLHATLADNPGRQPWQPTLADNPGNCLKYSQIQVMLKIFVCRVQTAQLIKGEAKNTFSHFFYHCPKSKSST